MKHFAAFLLAATATPALAQHQHHAEPVGARAEEMAEAPADPHAHHAMEEPRATADPHAAHRAMPAPPPAQADPHAAHAAQEAHAAHAGHAPGIPDPPVAPPSAVASRGPRYAADAIFGTAAMARAREIVRKEHGHIVSGTILIDQLEAVVGKGKDGYAWNAQGWYGGDIDKLWIKTEGESRFGERPQQAEVQALWSHALDPWWNLQTGIRQDLGAGPDRTYATLGVQGLAPYWLELDAALFVSRQGDVTARIEGEYDQRLTRKLILQTRAEVNVAAQDVPELHTGSGLSSAELGLRLRYQFVPEFAPYVGVEYERAFGGTADFRRAEGEKAGDWRFLMGVRTWF